MQKVHICIVWINLALNSHSASPHTRAGLPDVERLTRKLERQRNVTLSDLCQLYRASSRLPSIISELSRAAEGGASALQARFIDPLTEAHDAGWSQRTNSI
jgi:DNA mismatch repair protein MSH2